MTILMLLPYAGYLALASWPVGLAVVVLGAVGSVAWDRRRSREFERGLAELLDGR